MFIVPKKQLGLHNKYWLNLFQMRCGIVLKFYESPCIYLIFSRVKSRFASNKTQKDILLEESIRKVSETEEQK